jgi:hypothetical protein
MNAIMDISGKTIYRIDDSQPPSDTIIWTSLKSSKYFWRNTLKDNKLVTVTIDNTPNILTIPFTGNAMICVQGYFTAYMKFFHTINGLTDLNPQNSIVRKNNIAGFACGSFVREVKIGDKIQFSVENANSYEIQVYQIS